MSRHSRRSFLQNSAIGAAVPWALLTRLPRVSAAQSRVSPDLVHLEENIEPLVELIEESSRERLLEQVADRIHQGASYQEVVAALLLAGVRNVQPRPSVGFKFHCVLCVNSCLLASQAGPDEDRWLPIFWALDYFKSAQADEASKSGWRMAPVDEAKVPQGSQARQQFIDAMDRWDIEQADVATAGLVRTAGATEIFNLFAKYAARDFRAIGHKAIFLANGWRTLQVIGWQHAEPVLRSLSFALLNHENEPDPATSDLAPDRPWREGEPLAAKFPASWLDGQVDSAATGSLLEVFRDQSASAANEAALDMVTRGVAPASLWDGVFVGAGELLMRQPGIVGLHGLTTANAMYYLWANAADDTLRQRLLLQACAFNTMFRDAAARRGALKSDKLDDLLPRSAEHAEKPSLDDVFENVSVDRPRAARQVHEFLAAGGSPGEVIDAARRLLFSKGRDAHDYKFSSAVLEDVEHVSPEWQNRFLALSVFNLRGARDRDNQLVQRIRSALS